MGVEARAVVVAVPYPAGTVGVQEGPELPAVLEGSGEEGVAAARAAAVRAAATVVTRAAAKGWAAKAVAGVVAAGAAVPEAGAEVVAEVKKKYA